MDKPFDVKMKVLLPDGTKYDMDFNLLDIKREFSCAICSSIGDDEKISLLSMSDHFARHYVENNRAQEINNAITEDLKKPVRSNETLHELRKDIDDYDRAIDGAIMNKSSHGQAPVYYNDEYGGLSEDQMLQMAMEESMREAEQAKEILLPTQVPTVNLPTVNLPTVNLPTVNLPTVNPPTQLLTQIPTVNPLATQIKPELSTVNPPAPNVQQPVVYPQVHVPVVTYPPRKKKGV
jgi:hypothetical protein